MNKFAKYVPEEDKKKQREHIGAMSMDDMPFGKEYTTFEEIYRGDNLRFSYNVSPLKDCPMLIEGARYVIVLDESTRFEACATYREEEDIVMCRFYSELDEDGDLREISVGHGSDGPADSTIDVRYVHTAWNTYDQPNSISLLREVTKYTTLDSKYLPEALQIGENVIAGQWNGNSEDEIHSENYAFVKLIDGPVNIEDYTTMSLVTDDGETLSGSISTVAIEDVSEGVKVADLGSPEFAIVFYK